MIEFKENSFLGNKKEISTSQELVGGNFEQRNQEKMKALAESILDPNRPIESTLEEDANTSRKLDEEKLLVLREKFNQIEDGGSDLNEKASTSEMDKLSKSRKIEATAEEREAELIEQKRFIESSGSTELNRMLAYAKFGKEVLLHVSPSKTLQLSEKLGFIRDGFEKLAEVLKNDPKLKGIKGSSWIMEENPRLVERMGFAIKDVPIMEKMIARIFRLFKKAGEHDAYKYAYMSREDFLKRYGKEAQQ